MATEVKVPALGESITSGIIASWNVKDGDYVEKDQVLYELETDKITSEGLAEVAGVISLAAAEGDEVDIGAVIASIDESASAPDKADKAEKADDSKQEAKAEDKEKTEDKKESVPEKKSDAISPAVRRIAEEEDIDPARVTGTGKDGRVTKGDMLTATHSSRMPAEEEKKPAASAPSAAKPVPSGERTTRKKMTPLRAKIAERLVSAQQEAAMLTTFNEVDMSAVMGLRKKYQDAFVKKNGVKLGFMSLFVKAVVNGLKEVPGINAQIDGNEIVQNHFYDIGIAVSTPKGLMVPVVRDCDQLGLAEIEQSIIGYANKAREGKISIDDLTGGVFTITNGGIFGSMLSTPILNAPQSGILGMHTIQERPVAINGQVEIRPMMYLAVSYDHRIVDGKEAVTFLVKVKQALEDPARLLLEV
ncbi:2-oxoglutarate dehydrogenase complex dihydrolipoyllysine-residue succinyltransferase [Pelagicoccus sp. SDUM812002]|uniref:2-oxoglutarate dehydrogenase complex dihydrolipoyllysine-residue succinyltransferase n=1 Tax=Pelagicoccus sp. SDUM812002 TaxID=3041266 RepID=UPI00280E0DD8|nr:2-oxoglutarate dehydrogenase complex dihydrolipoyllysine-residue succinyltransferase [Pelagicoccus sp. SDUM812002]MDQ8185604.1 2-oxoglutarate dehydrogenase complex dihydrolipoyllysine-residue succinyltransferase [Pelagicoccus sp. SDUM812002]